ncbi:bifunctional metallophosphatase/5'-nucleotidase [soil metagenome]
MKIRLLAAAMAVVALGGAAACAPVPPPEAQPVPVQLLSFNDFHGYLEPPAGTDATLGATLDPTATPVGGAEYLATELSQLRATATNSLTVAAGDNVGGTPFLSGLFHDEPSVDSLETLGLDVTSVGNHEFDEGLTELKRLQHGGCHPTDGCYFPDSPYDGADFPWLAANVFYGSSDKTVMAPTWTTEVEGQKIGFIGMTLEGTPELVAQAGIRGLQFRDEVQSANAAATKLQADGVQSIVVLLHEGGVQTGTYQDCTGISGPVVDIATGLAPSIDMVVTGHTHQPYICSFADPAGNPRTVTSASSFGRVVTETNFQIDPATHDVLRNSSTSTHPLVARTLTPDPAQTALITKWKELAAPFANEVVGTITSDIVAAPNRDAESSLNNLIADAQLEATEAAGDGGAQVAFMNPGGVRANLTASQISGGEAAGEVTYGEAFAVQPFGNLLVTMDMTGEQIERVLEAQAIATRSRPVLILGVSDGFTFDYSASAPFGERIDPASIKLNGTVIAPTDVIRVTTNAFLADGGDNFDAFEEGTNRAGGGDDLTALIDYLGAHSPIAPTPTDRINELP